jgi:hypothetical protein
MRRCKVEIYYSNDPFILKPYKILNELNLTYALSVIQYNTEEGEIEIILDAPTYPSKYKKDVYLDILLNRISGPSKNRSLPFREFVKGLCDV